MDRALVDGHSHLRDRDRRGPCPHWVLRDYHAPEQNRVHKVRIHTSFQLSM